MPYEKLPTVLVYASNDRKCSVSPAAGRTLLLCYWPSSLSFFSSCCAPNSKNRVYKVDRVSVGLISSSSFLTASCQEVLKSCWLSFLTLFCLFHPLLTRPCCFYLPIHPLHSHQRGQFPHLPLIVPHALKARSKCLCVLGNIFIHGLLYALVSHRLGQTGAPCLLFPVHTLSISFSVWWQSVLIIQSQTKATPSRKEDFPRSPRLRARCCLPCADLVLNSHSSRPRSRRFISPDFGVSQT